MNNSKIILGISEEHDAGVSIVEDGKIIYAINEERLTRNKFQGGFPSMSIKRALSFLQNNEKLKLVQGVSVAAQTHIPHGYFNNKKSSEKSLTNFATYLVRSLSKNKYTRSIVGSALFSISSKNILRMLQQGRRKRWKVFCTNLKQMYSEIRADIDNVRYYDHHYCHATSAYYTSGFSDCLVVTYDGQGDGLCSSAYWCKNGDFVKIKTVPFFHSVGYYYTAITLLLGFKIGQEGKVTGLAARGSSSETYKLLKNRISYNKEQGKFINNGFYFRDEAGYLKKLLANFNRDDVAAGIQRLLEESITKYIVDLIGENENVHLAMAGGVFANVSLNKKISNIHSVSRLFVHPSMGDGGLASGAAFAEYYNNDKTSSGYKMNDCYLGDSYSNKQIKKYIIESGLTYTYFDDIENKIAELLSEGNVIAHYYGRMEYGPRALGNRSILYKADDAEVNQWLNKRLKRSEFMPFAPIIMDEHADTYFEINNNQRLACEFMTMTVNCKDICKKKSPAVVHIDGSARPQIVKKKTNSRLHKILENYYKISGVPVLVNTSFNMHEEPIVESPSMAIDAFTRGDLDFLVLNSYLLKR